MNQQIFHNPKNQRLDILDQRYYNRKGEYKYYPSLTHIIKSGAPAAPELIKFFKSNGFNSDRILREAGEFGSIVHDMIDRSNKGNKLEMKPDENNRYPYTMEQWEAFLKYVDFREKFKPEILANEVIIISDYYKVGQTIDMVCKIGNDYWIIDFKTSNYIHKDHFVQIAINAMSWHQFYPEYPITRVGLLHLKALTRGPDSKGKKMQGKGWEIVEPPLHFKNYVATYNRRYEEWLEENKDYKPKIYSLPAEIPGYAKEIEITGFVDKQEQAA